MKDRPVIAHVLYRLATGGMERVLVTVINRTQDQYRHAVICLDEITAYRARITAPDVACVALHKQPGKDWPCYFRLWKAIRELKPDLVHTYNFGALDAAPVAKLAGVRRVVHAERGRSASDPEGISRKHRVIRRCLRPFIDDYVTVSRDLRDWLVERVGIDASKVVCIPNGIDTTPFLAGNVKRETRPKLGSFAPPGSILIGTVGRLDPVKDQAGLLTAFGLLCDSMEEERSHLRLVIVGEGPQRAALERRITELKLESRVCLLGNREDITELLAEFDIFVLSSIAEGMPGAVLEAMAAGLPVVATDVGGVREVVSDGATGRLVPESNPAMLAEALSSYVVDGALRVRHGSAARRKAETGFSLEHMVAAYVELYDGLLDAWPSAASALTEQKEH